MMRVVEVQKWQPANLRNMNYREMAKYLVELVEMRKKKKIRTESISMNTKTTPKYRFCWHCGKQLRANFYQEWTDEHGHTYIVHRQCKEVLEGKSDLVFDNL